MPTINELLTTYNDLAGRSGREPINAWKKTRRELEERVQSLRDSTITIAAIARELGMDPKVARAKIRNAGLHKAGDEWPIYERDSAQFAAVKNELMKIEQRSK